MPPLNVKLKTRDVAVGINDALLAGHPYVLTRMGDGEAAFLIWAGDESIITPTRDYIWQHYRISPDNTEAVVAILNGLPICDAFGIPTLEPWADMWNTRAGVIRAFAIWGYDLSAMPITHQFIARFLIIGGHFRDWLTYSFLVLNEDAEAISDALSNGRYAEVAEKYDLGPVKIAGSVTLGWDEIDEAVERAVAHDFDIALVGAGVRKYALCHLLAARTNKIVLDVGHVLNSLTGIKPGAISGNPKRTLFGRDWDVAEEIARERPDEI